MDNQEYRLDMDSLLWGKRISSVWAMTNYPKTQVDKKPWGDVVKYQSTMERLLFNCVDDTFQIEALINYSGRSGEGAPVERMILPPHKQKFYSVTGSDYLTKIKAVVCAKTE